MLATCENGCVDGACVKEIIEGGMDSCLDNPSNYWDQETDKCYSGYSKDSLKDLCSDPDGGKNVYEYAHELTYKHRVFLKLKSPPLMSHP